MNQCPNCGKKVKVISKETFVIREYLKLTYCPKCEYYESDMIKVSVFKGIAQRGIDKRKGEFRLKIVKPEESSKKEMIIQTFPKTIVTKPSEWRSSGRRIYKTRGRTANVYPALKRKDEVTVAGHLSRNFPLISFMMKNETLGITSEFVENQISLKKGWISSFSIRNPILVESEKLIDSL